MSTINYDLSKIKSFVFDVDGVLSSQTITLSPDGEPLRSVNIQDGYAIHQAIQTGYDVAIITGGNSAGVKKRFELLGVKHIYMASSTKIKDYMDYIEKTGFNHYEVLYAGDDIPDYEVMRKAGLPVAPADAAPEIKKISRYISSRKGGEGVARDVIEQVLKLQGNWMNKQVWGW